MLTTHQSHPQKDSGNSTFREITTPQTRRERAWFDQMMRHQSPHYEEVTVTPSLAEMMLERNKSNRRVTVRQVREFSRLIKAGLFLDSPQPIAFSRDGALLNGQHRLMAIRDAAMPVKMRVFFGEDPEVFKVLDSGRKRTQADVMGMRGVPNAHDVAASLRCDLVIKAGATNINALSFSASEILDAYADNPDYLHLDAAIRMKKLVSNSVRGGKINSGLTVGFLRILRANNDAARVQEFAKDVAHGLNIVSTGSPILRLRKRFQDGVRDPIQTAAIVIKAWNFHVYNRNCFQLSWSDREPFPQPVPGSPK